MRIWLARSMVAACVLLPLGARAADALDAARPDIGEEAREIAAAMARDMGTEAMMRQMLDKMRDQLVTVISARTPQASARKAVDDIIMPEFLNGVGTMTARVVDIYATHFDVDELKQLRAFYETPLGRKSIRALPEIMRESQAAGESWARTTLQEIITKRGDDLRALGVDLSK